MARCFGLSPAPLEGCRVLEIGCADGTNLLPYAEMFPDSRFVGFDLVAERIEEANHQAQQLNLQNAEFRTANVRDVDTSWGKFDYILCPGVFSWSTDEEREAVLRVCRENLSPGGSAVVSWNVRPGWDLRGIVRHFIRQHVQAFASVDQKVVEARKAVEFLARCTPDEIPASRVYREVCETLRTSSDYYLYHDFITDFNQPLYFREFNDRLVKHDLQFVCEADMAQVAALGLSSEAQQTLARTRIPEREQLLDYLVNSSYRRSMLTHAETPLNRQIDYRVTAGAYVALAEPVRNLNIRPDSREPVTLQYSSGSFTMIEPLGKAAMIYLAGIYPAPVEIDRLYQESIRLLPEAFHSPAKDDPDSLTEGQTVMARSMLAAFGAGLIRMCVSPPPISQMISDRPRVSAFNRLRAEQGRMLVSQWHQSVPRLSAEERFLIRQLDGNANHDQLNDRLKEFRFSASAGDGSRPDSSASPSLQRMLLRLAVDRSLLIE
ncbi:MAG: methyltransferase regulatory domain-containing protein [Planctomycetaceae bacterium]|nr:methyltransferase regulatory domain-containing protein [Planctomycetaceae bacterium]